MQFRWRRLVVKEYGTPFGWVSILALMGLYNLWLSGHWSARQSDVRLFEDVLLVAILVWLVAWGLKRTRLLEAD